MQVILQITKDDVLESILNATFVQVKNSTSTFKKQKKEKVYIINSFCSSGIYIYSKGLIRKDNGKEYFYLLISSKRSVIND